MTWEYFYYTIQFIFVYIIYTFVSRLVYYYYIRYFGYRVNINERGIETFSKVRGVIKFYRWEEIEGFSSVFRPPLSSFPLIILKKRNIIKSNKKIKLRATSLNSKYLQKNIEKYFKGSSIPTV